MTMTIESSDRLALDRASVRQIDADGRLHIAVSPISKANVCPYYGREIPNSEAMGLDPNKVYMLLRDPIELEKAAATFNNIPLLNKHIPVHAREPQKESVVGSTGTDAAFGSPYLHNSLVIWDASSIAGIESGEQKELSASYRYVADMTPGVFEGVPYDGRMTNINGNHVALVPSGRAGADVAVGDSLPEEFLPMRKSKTALALRAALGAYLRPRLAQDSALPPLKTLVKSHSTLEGIAMDTKSLLQDVQIDVPQLTTILKLAADEAENDDEEPGKKKAEDEEEDDNEGKKSNVKAAEDEDDEDEDNDKSKKNEADKANDAALMAARKGGRDDALREFCAIRQAEEDVRLLVGGMAAMDSAEAVYRFALDSLGVDTQGIHPSAFPAMVKLMKANQTKPTPSVAMDAAADADFHNRFPTAAKVKRI